MQRKIENGRLVTVTINGKDYPGAINNVGGESLLAVRNAGPNALKAGDVIQIDKADATVRAAKLTTALGMSLASVD